MNKAGRVVGYRAKPFYKGKALAGYSKTFPTRAKAKAYVDSVLNSIKTGSLIDRKASESITLNQALREYWDEVGRYMNGAEALGRRVDALKCNKMASLPLSALKTSDILKLQNVLLETKKPSTVINDLTPISAAIKHAKVKHDMPYLLNPCDGVKSPSTRGNSRNRRLSGDEKRVLLSACYGSGNRWLLDVVQLAVELGLRQEKLISLKWSQVDFENKVIRYESGLVSNKGVPPTAPFTRKLERILLKMHKRTGSGDYVFPTTKNAIRVAFNKAKKIAGIEDFRFHDLRHEAISRMFDEGLDQVDIMKITGIKSAQTLARYTHPSDEYLVNLRYR